MTTSSGAPVTGFEQDPPPTTTPARPPARSLARRLVSASSWRILAQVAPLFVNLALTPYVITTLGLVAYGLWIVTTTLAAVIAHLDGGISRSAQYYFALLVGREDKVGLTRLLTTLSGAAVCVSGTVMLPAFLLASDIAEFFQAPPQYLADMAFLLRVFIVMVAFSLVRGLLVSVLHSHERFRLTSIANLVSYVLYAIAMVVALESGMGLRGMAYAFVVQHAVATLFIVPPALPHLSRRGIGFVSRSQLMDVIRVSWRIQVANLLWISSLQGVTLIVGRLRPLQVPDFGPGSTFAQQLKTIPLNAIAPVQAMLGRSMGAQGQQAALKDFTQLQRLWVRGVTGWVAVAIPAAYVGVNVWLPLEGDLAGRVAAIMLVAELFSLLPQVLMQWMLQVGRTQYEMWSMAATVAVVLGGSFALVPLVGAVGAAVAAVAGQLTGLVWMVLAARRLEVAVPSPLSSVPWWQAAVAGALSWAGAWAMEGLVQAGHAPDGGIGLLLCGAAAGPALLVYALLTWGPGTVLRTVRSRLPGRR